MGRENEIEIKMGQGTIFKEYRTLRHISAEIWQTDPGWWTN